MGDAERDAVKALYRKRAGHDDWTANLYYLIGYRGWAYRRRAVAALGLGAGDAVVEMCCGTGLNFSLLQGRSARGAGSSESSSRWRPTR